MASYSYWDDLEAKSVGGIADLWSRGISTPHKNTKIMALLDFVVLVSLYAKFVAISRSYLLTLPYFCLRIVASSRFSCQHLHGHNLRNVGFYT